MSETPVRVVIYHGTEPVMTRTTENDTLPHNVPAAARLLMDSLYLMLDDQVSIAKLRAHRRQLRDAHRGRAVGQVNAGSEEEASE